MKRASSFRERISFEPLLLSLFLPAFVDLFFDQETHSSDVSSRINDRRVPAVYSR